jgi:UDPglucose 6-dehydrogenase
MSKVGIVGYGYVGKGMHKIFPDAVIYDEPLGIGTRKEIDKKDLSIICVPTPSQKIDSEFKPADTSIVEEVISWIESPLILIKSTIPPQTTERLVRQTGKRICFSPEYMGEGGYHISPWKYMSPTDPQLHNFVIIGGGKKTREEIADIFTERLGPEKTYYLCEATEAEMIKYLENSYIGLKVAFFNQIHDLCQKLGISFHTVREGWALDNRVDKMHTSVFVNKRKIGGKCLPKDMNALVAKADELGVDLSILKAIVREKTEK